jgi:SAM-dependent methyltransferase
LASVQLGERSLHGRFLGLDREIFRTEPVRALAHRFFWSWMVGGIVLGAIVGGLGGLVAWMILKRRPQVADPIADAIDVARHRYDREPGKFKFYARMKYVMDPCYRAIAAQIAPGTFTVDLGTGLGMLPVLLGLMGERRALGVEWDAGKAGAGARAASGLTGVEIVAGDARSCAIPSCDVITIVDVLHYYDAEAQRDLLVRCKASLRPGGRLLIREGDEARGGGAHFTRAIEAVVTKLGWNRGPRVKFRPIVELEADLETLGFSVARDQVAGAMHPGNVLLVCSLGQSTSPQTMQAL